MPEFILTPFDMLLLNTPPKFLKDETKKIRKRIKNKKWKFENKDKINKNKREKRRENKDEINKNRREKRRENKDEINKKKREKRRENKDEINKKRRDDRVKNPEKYLVDNEKRREKRKENKDEINKKRREDRVKNPKYWKKSQSKSKWKASGLNMDNFEEIYKRYISTTHCDLCNVELTEDKITTKTTRVMDHSHITGEFRNVLCHSCNSSLPKWT